MKTWSILGVLTLLFATVAFGQAVERTHDIVPEDYFSQVFLTDCAVSPDGEMTAFVDYRWDKVNDRRSQDLWMVDNETMATTRLTFDPGNEVSPQWSPDNEWVYFLGHISHGGDMTKAPYDGSSQVWRINPDGNGLMPVTSVPGGIYGYELSADGETLYYTLAKEISVGEWQDMRATYANVTYAEGTNEVCELWKLNLMTWRADKVFAPDLHIHEFSVSPNEQKVAMITTESGELIELEGWSNVTIYDVATGDSYDLYDQLWRDDAPSPHGWLGEPTWNDSGNKLAFTVDFDGYPAEVIVSDFTERAANLMRMPRPEMVHVAGHIHWLPDRDDEIAFVGHNLARQRVYSVELATGNYKTLTNGDVVIDNFGFAGDGEDLVAIQSTLTYYQDLVYYDGNKSTRITKLNPQVDSWKLPQIKLVEWEGANGDMVSGILELPPDYEPGQKLPLHLTLHGGPTVAEPYCFQLWIYGRASFAAKGWAMLSPNYRGSLGYGDEFLTGLIGHENDWDVQDIMAGVDYLIEEGIVDEDKMGVSGWSNGGFLTNALIASNRFKAASTGAGVLDMTMQLVMEDTPGHVVNFMQSLPWENPEAYIHGSPIFTFHDGIKTAVLIHVGENDPRVPAAHSIGLHRMLKHYLGVNSELIIYPGAGHNLTKYTHRLAKAKWDHAWFDKYVLGK